MNFNYKIVRSSKRKTIALQIKNAEVTVRAPTKVPQSYIDKLIQKKTPWIIKKLNDSKQNKLLPISFLPNKTILIHGNPKVMNICFHKKALVSVEAEIIRVFIPERLQTKVENLEVLEQQIKKQIHSWMKEDTSLYLERNLPQFSKQLNLYPTSYKIRFYKSRWGSCNNKHELRFNYLLSMVPRWVFDYVIVHELSHIMYLNHSPNFWALVSQHLPNYKQAHLWFKENQQHLY